jgi:GT2 family glycosyltransferase
MLPILSVVIPTYQRRASVEQALTALREQTLAPEQYEVIVVIDGSNDGTYEMAASFESSYTLRAILQPNQGRATACNTGIQAARGVIVVLLDDDMDAAPQLLEAHWQANEKALRIGVIGAAPMQYDDTSSPAVAYVGAKFNEHLERLAQPDRPIKVRDFYSGNFSIRRDLLLEVGLFDEGFKIYGNEDVELSMRLAAAGINVVFSPPALAYQRYTKDFAGLARDNIAKGRTSVLLARKHPETIADLKLSTFEQASPRWRLARSLLLAQSRRSPTTVKRVIRAVGRLERLRPLNMRLVIQQTLDFCYWYGVEAELCEQGFRDAAATMPKALALLVGVQNDQVAVCT